MNALWNAPISDRFSSLCARVFSPAAAILESEKTLGTRLGDFFTNQVASFKLLGAMVTKMVTTWRVETASRIENLSFNFLQVHQARSGAIHAADC